LSFTKSPEEPGLAGCEAVLQNTIYKEKSSRKSNKKGTKNKNQIKNKKFEEDKSQTKER
jgi:hypothetical protein